MGLAALALALAPTMTGCHTVATTEDLFSIYSLYSLCATLALLSSLLNSLLLSLLAVYVRVCVSLSLSLCVCVWVRAWVRVCVGGVRMCWEGPDRRREASVVARPRTDGLRQRTNGVVARLPAPCCKPSAWEHRGKRRERKDEEADAFCVW